MGTYLILSSLNVHFYYYSKIFKLPLSQIYFYISLFVPHKKFQRLCSVKKKYLAKSHLKHSGNFWFELNLFKMTVEILSQCLICYYRQSSLKLLGSHITFFFFLKSLLPVFWVRLWIKDLHNFLSFHHSFLHSEFLLLFLHSSLCFPSPIYPLLSSLSLSLIPVTFTTNTCYFLSFASYVQTNTA